MNQIQLTPQAFTLIPQGTLQFPRERAVLFVFYPGDFTPTCTKQLCEYRDEYENFSALGCDLIGVSADSEESHKEMISKHKLPFPLLADPKKNLIKEFEMTHLGFLPKRGYALVGKKGNLLWKDNDTLPVFYTKTEALLQQIKLSLKGDQ